MFSVIIQNKIMTKNDSAYDINGKNKQILHKQTEINFYTKAP